MMITIVDYAINNLHSVQNAFRSLKIPSQISQDPETIRRARKLILPGVGAFADAMDNLRARNLVGCSGKKRLTGLLCWDCAWVCNCSSVKARSSVRFRGSAAFQGESRGCRRKCRSPTSVGTSCTC